MVVLGRVTAPYAVHGWVRIRPFGDDPESWADMAVWYVGDDADAQDEAAWRPLRLESLKLHGGDVLAKFEESPDRSAAEALKGKYVAAPREALPEPEEDEYYWGDLIGLEVRNLKGESLGRVRELLETGAHDVLCAVDGEGHERLLPFVAAVVKEVDVAGGTIRVDWEADW